MSTYNAKRLTIVKGSDTYIIDPMQGNESAYIDQNVTIAVNAWTGNNPYTYVYSDIHITSNSVIAVYFQDGIRNGLVGDLKFTKSTGYVTFETDELPIGPVPLKLRIIDGAVDGVYPVDASLVETDAIIGETTVQGALEDLDSRVSQSVTGNAKVFYGVTETTGEYSTKIVNAPGFTASDLSEGTILVLKSTYKNTADGMFLNINNTGDVPVYVINRLNSVGNAGLNKYNTLWTSMTLVYSEINVGLDTPLYGWVFDVTSTTPIDNLTTESDKLALSAKQGKVLKTAVDNKADKSAAISNITRDGTTFTATRADGTTFTFTQQDNNTTYSQVSRGSGAGLVPGLPSGTGTTKYLREDGSWQVPPDNNTTYSFSNNAPTLAWNTTSTVGTVGGVNLTVKMPANPNTNTTYSFSNGNPTLAWGTKSTVGTTGDVALTVTMPANPMTYKVHRITATGAINANSYYQYETNVDAFKVSGYTMVLSVPICYDGAIIGSNFTQTIISYFNKTSSNKSNLTLQFFSLYVKN